MIQQSALFLRPKERRPYQRFGAAITAWRSSRRALVLSGPAGCIAGETRIYNPTTGEHTPIKELCEKRIAPIVQTLMGAIQAEVPFKKGVADLYRLTLVSGRKCIVTLNHLLLSDNSWIYLSACSPGSRLLISSPSPLVTTEVSDPSVSLQDALRLSQRPLSYQEYCSAYPRQYGAQLRRGVDSVPSVALPLSGVLSRNRAGLYGDDLGFLSEYTHQHQRFDRHARTCCSPSTACMACTLSHTGQGTFSQADASFLYDEQFQREISPLCSIARSRQRVDNMRLHENSLKGCPPVLLPPLRDEQATQPLQQSIVCFSFSDTIQEYSDAVLPSNVCDSSISTSDELMHSNKLYCSTQWDTVSSIEYVRTDEYFDLHVPIAEHYLAEGIWHHNTGKSRACLEKLHFCADKYPRMRGLILRKTRESITQTAMVTYQEKVLPEGWLDTLIKWRTSEQEYRYPNGSIIAVGGLDKASKIMSSEWDMIYVQEATELTEEDWGALTTRLRNGAMPYQQLIADCNPSYPTHWLKQRADRGEILMLESRHEDNPTVTPEYLAALDELPGVLKDRLRYGRWAAAEGMVYEEWDAAVHVLSKKQLVGRCILNEDGTLNRQVVKRVLASCDWGFSNPGVIQVYALDGDDRAYMVREVYQTQRDIDWWIPRAIAIKQEFGVTQFICDPSEPSYIAQFNKKQLNAIAAVNDIAPGISAMHSRLKIAGDGQPRFYVYEYALAERDESRVSAHHPFCFTMEIDAYAWPKSKDGAPVKEVPVKVNDHACLAAGTMITTDHGDIPIEQIKAGDHVLTRYGYKRVSDSGMTAQDAKVYTLYCSNGSSIVGTANHPIYIRGKGYIDLLASRYGDIIETPENYTERGLTCPKECVLPSQRLLPTKALISDAIRTHQALRHATITRLMQTIAPTEFSGCIKRFGKMLTVLFQKDIISIIETETHSIIPWKTLSAFRRLITTRIMARCHRATRSVGTWKMCDLLLLSGMDRMWAGHGIENLENWLGKRQKSELLYVNSANLNSNTLTWDRSQSFALTTVNPLLVASLGWTMNSVYVQNATASLPLTNTAELSAAHPVVLGICENAKNQPVYNLTVEANTVGEGEYFANGILVHNCDAARYMAMHLADPTPTSQDHLQAMARRKELAQSRALHPVLNTSIMQPNH